MKKHLMILGDTRIGDTFHVGTYLNRLKDEYETTWVHGGYERLAVEFLKDSTDMNIVETIKRDSTCNPFPMDLASIESFISKYKKDYDYSKYDKVTDFTGPIFFGKGDPIAFNTKVPEFKDKDPYIVTHVQSISNWKEFGFFINMDFGLRNYGVGKLNGKLNCKALDMRGIPMSELASLIKGAKAVVGIHSSVACLAFHLGTPLIALHFWDGKATIKFSDFRDKCEDIIEPNEDKVLETLKKYL